MNIDFRWICEEAKLLDIVLSDSNLSKRQQAFLLAAIRSDLTQQDYERLGRIIKYTENIDEVKNECLENLNLLENKIKKDNNKFVEIFTGRYLVTRDDYFKMLKSQISELNFSQDRKNPKTYGFWIVNKDEAFNKK